MPKLKPSRKFRSRGQDKSFEAPSQLLQLISARRIAKHCEKAIEDALRDAVITKTDSKQERILTIFSEIVRRYLNTGELPPLQEDFIRQLEAHLKQQTGTYE